MYVLIKGVLIKMLLYNDFYIFIYEDTILKNYFIYYEIYYII